MFEFPDTIIETVSSVVQSFALTSTNHEAGYAPFAPIRIVTYCENVSSFTEVPIDRMEDISICQARMAMSEYAVDPNTADEHISDIDEARQDAQANLSAHSLAGGIWTRHAVQLETYENDVQIFGYQLAIAQ